MGVQRIPYFDTYRANYAGANINIYREGTTELADVYFDFALTNPAPNPVTLITLEQNGVAYGKWPQPLYTDQAYYLDINSVEQTGVTRPPLLSLAGEDGSDLLSDSVRGSRKRQLEAIFDTVVDAEFFGSLETENAPATNTATLVAAIGAAAAQGGGAVFIKAGTFPITLLNLPVGVVLVGQGIDATTLQSSDSDKIITLSGDRAGLADLTLDGLSLAEDSVGVYSEANDRTRMERVIVKRFHTGIQFLGGQHNHWLELSILNCVDGGIFVGDLTTGATGDEFSHNRWEGGKVSQHTGDAIRLDYFDAYVRHNTFVGIEFFENTGTTIHINGARYSRFEGCEFDTNVQNFDVHDDTDTSKFAENTVVGLYINGGRVADGENKFDGHAQDIMFERMHMGAVSWNLTLPDNVIILRDTTEDFGSSVIGDAAKLNRSRTTLNTEVVGVTTDSTAITAFSYNLAAGEVVYAEVKAIGRQRDGAERAIYHMACGAQRPGDNLDFDNQVSNFTIGNMLTGQTSGATGRIVALTDNGTSGVLGLRDIRGEFEDNEIIQDTGGGSAQVNGNLTPLNAALDTVGEVDLRTKYETTGAANWEVDFGVSNQQLIVTVAGADGQIVEWTVSIDLKIP